MSAIGPLEVAVVGAGTMGAGIAQLTATSGHPTTLVDVDEDALDRATAAIATGTATLVRKGRLSPDAAEAALGRVATASHAAPVAAGADVVIETVVELLEVKQAVFREVAAAAPSHALLATNTSQLSITAIASAVPDVADRVVGLHFFNPPMLMDLVEVIRGIRTADETVDRAVAFATSLGRQTVVCEKDSPGFLTSRISAIVRLECLRMLEEGVANAADIDKALRLGLNFPIGPLELGDRNGHDTFLHVLESLERTLGSRFRPTVNLRNLVAAGDLGRKSGRGIYTWGDDGRIVPDRPT